MLARSGALIEGIAEAGDRQENDQDLRSGSPELERLKRLSPARRLEQSGGRVENRQIYWLFLSAVGVISTLIAAAWALYQG